MNKQEKKTTYINPTLLYVLSILTILIIWGCLFMNWNLLFPAIVELGVSGLMFAAASQSHSNRVKTFLWIGATALIILAGYQLIQAFGWDDTMVELSSGLLFGGGSAIIGVISIKLLPKTNKKYRKYANIFYVSTLLTLLIALGLEYVFSIVWSYVFPFILSVVYLSYILILIIYKNVDLEEEKEYKEPKHKKGK